MYKSASLLLRFHLPPAAGQPPSQQRTGHTGQLPSIVWKRHHLLAIAAMQAVMHTNTNTNSYDMPKTEDPLPWPDCVMKGSWRSWCKHVASLPSRCCPSPTPSESLSPSWQPIVKGKHGRGLRSQVWPLHLQLFLAQEAPTLNMVDEYEVPQCNVCGI